LEVKEVKEPSVVMAEEGAEKSVSVMSSTFQPFL
jgi:hypothetical protein